MKKNSHSIIKVVIVGLVLTLFSCKEKNHLLYGNWSWISENNKYFEVLIDSSKIIGYRHSFLYPREYKIVKDSIYLDKINNKDYALRYRIERLKDGGVLLKGRDGGNVYLYEIKDVIFTIDSIDNDDDLDRYELEYTTRKEKWEKENKQNN